MKKTIFMLIVTLSFGAFSASETVKGAKKDYEEFKTKMSAELEKTEAKIVELKVKAKIKGSEAEGKAVTELEKKRAELKVTLDESKEKGKNSWKKFKKKFASSIDALNKKVQKSLED